MKKRALWYNFEPCMVATFKNYIVSKKNMQF